MSHNSDLPLHWRVSLRRAFNARVNALCGYSSEAGDRVRDRLLQAVVWFERRPGRHPSGDQLADFLEQVSFDHLFSDRSDEACFEAVMASVEARRALLAQMDARDRAAQLATGIGAALRREEQGAARLAWTPGRRRVRNESDDE